MRLLCLACRREEDVDPEGPPTYGCPGCGDRRGTPANLDDSVTITLSRHELRVLTFWASNFAAGITTPEYNGRAVMATITDRLGIQTDTALTLSQEIADVRAAFPDSEVTVHDADGHQTNL